MARVLTDSRNCSFGEEPLFVAMKVPITTPTPLSARWFAGCEGISCGAEDAASGRLRLRGGSERHRCLQQLAAHHRTRFKGRVVGITGSNGKTVVKEWIAQQIPAGVKYFRSPKSYNSQLGVALSLLMIEGDEELALIEAGISCPGEMVRLERMIRPDTVIFTSIGEAHQEIHLARGEECRKVGAGEGSANHYLSWWLLPARTDDPHVIRRPAVAGRCGISAAGAVARRGSGERGRACRCPVGRGVLSGDGFPDPISAGFGPWRCASS